MPETDTQELSGVAETLLLPLYVRAMESRRPDALIRDEKAVALINELNPDSSWVEKMRLDEEDMVGLVLRNREFDRRVREYLAGHETGVVIHIGCGLDSRFERVDNGTVEWYDLDLPEVIELRRKLIGGEGERYHLLGCSVLDSNWQDAVASDRQRTFFFVAEGVFMYFEEAQVRSLFLTLCDRFPGAELVCDAYSPYMVWLNNLRIARTKIGARYHWGLKRGRDVERWRETISLLDEWSYFSHPEPRLARVRWMRFIPLLAKASGIFHYRLGQRLE